MLSLNKEPQISVLRFIHWKLLSNYHIPGTALDCVCAQWGYAQVPVHTYAHTHRRICLWKPEVETGVLFYHLFLFHLIFETRSLVVPGTCKFSQHGWLARPQGPFCLCLPSIKPLLLTFYIRAESQTQIPLTCTLSISLMDLSSQSLNLFDFKTQNN